MLLGLAARGGSLRRQSEPPQPFLPPPGISSPLRRGRMSGFLRVVAPRHHPTQVWGMLVGTPRSPLALGPGLVGEHPAFPERLCFSRTFSALFPTTFPLVVLLESSSPREGERPRSALPAQLPTRSRVLCSAPEGSAGDMPRSGLRGTALSRRLLWWGSGAPAAASALPRPRRSSQLLKDPRNGGAGAAGRQARETGLRERGMPPARRGTETLFQEQPETGNQYLEDALLQSYLRAHLPAQVGFGSACPGHPSGRGGTVARGPPVPPRVSPGAFQRSFELLVLEWAPG